jgi:hypothetical protein
MPVAGRNVRFGPARPSAGAGATSGGPLSPSWRRRASVGDPAIASRQCCRPVRLAIHSHAYSPTPTSRSRGGPPGFGKWLDETCPPSLP